VHFGVEELGCMGVKGKAGWIQVCSCRRLEGRDNVGHIVAWVRIGCMDVKGMAVKVQAGV
jgi:hypothetical protein